MKAKYFISLVVLTFLIVFSNATFAQAQETPNPLNYNGMKGTSGIFTYQTINDEGDIVITDIDTRESKLVIPAIIDGHQVKKINLEEVTSDGQLRNLKANLVSKNYVRELVISDGIEKICDRSFLKFTNLENITLAKDLQIGDAVFGTCPVKELTINGGGIGNRNFSYCEFKQIKIEGKFYGAGETFDCCTIKKVIVDIDAPYGYVGGIFADTKIKEMYVSKNVKKLQMVGQWGEDNQLDKLYIEGKKTGKAKTYVAKKQGSKYRVTWKKVRTTIQTNKYNKSKKMWSKKTKTAKTMYQVYGRKKKSGKFKLIKTTAQRNITSKYKYIQVVPVKSW